MSSSISALELLQLSPLQSPHAATHVKPFFRHEHKFVPQVFQDIVLQLQRTKFNDSFGAGSNRSLLVQRIFGTLSIPILMDLHWWSSTFSTVLLVDEHEGNDNK